MKTVKFTNINLFAAKPLQSRSKPPSIYSDINQGKQPKVLRKDRLGFSGKILLAMLMSIMTTAMIASYSPIVAAIGDDGSVPSMVLPDAAAAKARVYGANIIDDPWRRACIPAAKMRLENWTSPCAFDHRNRWRCRPYGGFGQ